MDNTIFFTYADREPFTTQAAKLVDSAFRHGITNSAVLRRISLNPHYVIRFASILNDPRGGGLWLWKSYLLEALCQKYGDDTTIIYCDSGFLWRGAIEQFLAPYFDQSPIVLFNNKPNEGPSIDNYNLLEKHWTKPVVIKDLNAHQHIDTQQVWAGFVAVKLSDYTRDFVRAWLTLCESFSYLIPEKGMIDGLSYEHRHDQSLLSILAKSCGIPINPFPSDGPLVNIKYPNH